MSTGYYNPYSTFSDKKSKWVMANFHMHNIAITPEYSYTEAGGESFREMAQAYKSAGYGLIMHSSQHGWYDSSMLSEELGMTVLNGQEHIFFRDGVLLVNTDRFYDTQDTQEAIDGCIARGGFAILNHPNQNPDLPMPNIPLPFSHTLLASLTHAVGVEIYNGCLSRRAYLNVPFGLSLGTDFWDEELTKGHRLWGFGNDDAHEAYEIHVGWTEIYSRSNKFDDIKMAVMKGALITSRGLRLEKFDFDGHDIRLKAGYTYQPCDQVTYRFVGPQGKVLAMQYGDEGHYKLSGETYVRVEAVSPDGSMLWTQPVLRTDIFDVSDIKE